MLLGPPSLTGHRTHSGWPLTSSCTRKNMTTHPAERHRYHIGLFFSCTYSPTNLPSSCQWKIGHLWILVICKFVSRDFAMPSWCNSLTYLISYRWMMRYRCICPNAIMVASSYLHSANTACIIQFLSASDSSCCDTLRGIRILMMLRMPSNKLQHTTYYLLCVTWHPESMWE